MVKEKLAYIGHLVPYRRGCEVAEKLLGIKTNATCIYRITEEVGTQSSEWLEAKQTLKESPPKDEQSVITIQVDGAMLLTVEESWKESKLGRIYVSPKEEVTDNQCFIKNSEYLSHFGNHIEFREKMDRLIARRDPIKTELVFINDGASWIEKWVTKEYPNATQILDFYHAMKHIADFIESKYGQGEEKKNMVEYWGHILKNDGVNELEKHINKERCGTKKARAGKQKVKKYLAANRYRMKYTEYKKKHYSIGSGAIESAHKTVIQCRMKLSGQRWSLKGARHMLDLRTVSMSGHWDWVEQHFRNAA